MKSRIPARRLNRMSKQLKISVIIPTYNRRAELLRAIDSVISQTLRPEEIIIIDDCSDFSVREFLAEKYGDSVCVITNRENMGAAESRNIGARRATGDYIAFLDSDDYWERNKLEVQASIFLARPDLDLVYCNERILSPDGSLVCRKGELFDHDIWQQLLDGWTAPNTSTLLFRRSSFLALGGFDSNLTSCQDHDLWMRMAQEKAKIAFSPECLATFGMGASNRISLDSRPRFGGMERFLANWEDAIVKTRGRRFYKSFRGDYRQKVAFPIFIFMLKRRQLWKMQTVFWHYIAFNRIFYRRILNRIVLWFKK